MMSFQDAVRTCFQKYVVISGRAQRSEYWWFFLFTAVVGYILGTLDGMFFSSGPNGAPSVLQGLFSLGTILPSICAGGRRLHDRDMSAWWMLLLLVPLIGVLVLLVMFALPGTRGPNRFGPDPLGGDGPAPLDEGFVRSSIPRSGQD